MTQVAAHLRMVEQETADLVMVMTGPSVPLPLPVTEGEARVDLEVPQLQVKVSCTAMSADWYYEGIVCQQDGVTKG